MAVRARSLSLALLVSAFALTGVSGAFARDVRLFAVLLGGNIVFGDQANAGDPNGRGTASVIVVSDTEICYSILVINMRAPFWATISEASAGVSGPRVTFLTAPSNGGNPGTSSGCVTVDGDAVRRLRDSPSDFYIQVLVGGGTRREVRGQLF
jgi:hypothetical protein